MSLDHPFLRISDSSRLEFDGVDLVELAEMFSPPVWVISEETLRHNIRSIGSAFRERHPDTRIIYASKANPEPAVLRVVRSEGCAVDAVTMGHLRLIEAAGFSASDVILNGNSKTSAEINWALRHGAGMINIDSLEELHAIASQQPFGVPPIRLCMRLATDPESFGDDPAFGDMVRKSKFGMSRDDILLGAESIASHSGLTLAGVHNHIGFQAGSDYSAEADLRRHRQCATQALELLRALDEEYPGVSVLNLGGGYRVPRAYGFGPGRLTDIPSVEEYAEALVTPILDLPTASRKGIRLLLEAGGYVAATAAILLTRVGFQKDLAGPSGPTHWVFVEETSGYHFVRRLLYDFFHQVVLARDPDRPIRGPANIAGAVCTEDSLARDLDLPEVERGELLVVLDQGAYCEAVTSDYCAIPIPGAVMVSDGRIAVVRKPETLDDIVSRFRIPSWL